MRLLIIGHTAHYKRGGELVGWGPTVKEINWLARGFDEVVHLACFHHGPAPESALAYEGDNIRLVFVPPGGGLSLKRKLRVLWLGPLYLWQIMCNLPKADVVHVRCPGSLGMYGMMAASLLTRQLKWVKYAGNWTEERNRMAPSHLFQRWWLRSGLIRGPVTINGRWHRQPAHVHSFLNPSISLQDIQDARDLVLDKAINYPVRVLFVGRASRAKGLDIALAIVKELHGQYGQNILFDIVGDGAAKPEFQQWVKQAGLGKVVTFYGWLSHRRVLELMAPAHFLLLPSRSEGWPKVLSEAMAYGAVPIASAISSIPQILERTKAGVALDAQDVPGFVQAISALIENPATWQEMSRAGLAAAPLFTYERYLMAVDALFASAYGKSPLNARYVAEMRRRFSDAAASELPYQFWLER